MKKTLILACVLLVAFSCKKQDEIINDGSLDKVDVTLTPSLVIAFDHVPSSDELYKAGVKYLANVAKDLSPTSSIIPDQNGEKLVILGVKTSSYTSAGTDDAASCRFIGKWVNNLGLYKTVAYILDKPGRDDLNRNAYNAFYYFINNETNVTDQFVSGQLKNSASDGWLCHYVDFQDMSCSGSRNVTLYWGDPSQDWVQSDGNILSRVVNSNLSTWLYYQNCVQ